MALVATACGGGGDNSGSSGSGGDNGGGSGSNASSGPRSLGTLSITVAGASTGNSSLWVAQQNGYFKKYGLDVNIINAHAGAFTEVTSGKVDLTMTGTAAGLAPVIQGKQTQMIYTWGLGPDVCGVVVAPNSPYHKLTDLAGQKVSSEGSSGSSYGTTQALSKYIKDQTGKGVTTIPLSSLPAQANQVISGRIAAAVGVASIWAPYVKAGKLRMLVNPGESPEAKQIFGSDLVNLAIWGLPEHIKDNKDKMVAFLHGLLDANAYIDKHTDKEVATVLAQNSLLAGNTVEQLAFALSLDRPFIDPTNGRITEDAWKHSLEEFGSWGLGVDPNNPNLSYAKEIDMSYLDAAMGKN